MPLSYRFFSLLCLRSQTWLLYNLFSPIFLLQLSRRVVSIDGYSDVPANNENLLLKAVAQQPVSVGICGSERLFQLYSKVCSITSLLSSHWRVVDLHPLPLRTTHPHRYCMSLTCRGFSAAHVRLLWIMLCW